LRALAWTAATTLALDQATKAAIVWGLNLFERGVIDVLPGILTFRMAWNRGINFGLFAGGDTTRWVLVALALVIAVWVTVWLWRSGAGRWSQVAGGLLVGGAIGNTIDRILYGAVADFLNVTCCGIENPYAFNVADIAIFAGAIGLALLGSGPGSEPKAGSVARSRRSPPLHRTPRDDGGTKR
jgi:signal peptidase II